MKIIKKGSLVLEEKLHTGGTLKVEIEYNGTVRIDGYLYWTDGKPYGKQLEFLDEAYQALGEMVSKAQNGISEDEDRIKWFEFWKLPKVFGRKHD